MLIGWYYVSHLDFVLIPWSAPKKDVDRLISFMIPFANACMGDAYVTTPWYSLTNLIPWLIWEWNSWLWQNVPSQRFLLPATYSRYIDSRGPLSYTPSTEQCANRCLFVGENLFPTLNVLQAMKSGESVAFRSSSYIKTSHPAHTIQTFLEKTKSMFISHYHGMPLEKITTTVGLNGEDLC